MKVENVERLILKLRKLGATSLGQTRQSVIVGYTQNYAIYVHENLEAYHEPPTRAKYLEGPARELSRSGELGRLAAATYRQTKDVLKSLLVAGLRIQRDSQKIVPVDTGALRNSAFTRPD